MARACGLRLSSFLTKSPSASTRQQMSRRKSFYLLNYYELARRLLLHS